MGAASFLQPQAPFATPPVYIGNISIPVVQKNDNSTFFFKIDKDLQEKSSTMTHQHKKLEQNNSPFIVHTIS